MSKRSVTMPLYASISEQKLAEQIEKALLVYIDGRRLSDANKDRLVRALRIAAGVLVLLTE